MNARRRQCPARAGRPDGVHRHEPVRKVELIPDPAVGVGGDVDVALPGLAGVVVDVDVDALARLPARARQGDEAARRIVVLVARDRRRGSGAVVVVAAVVVAAVVVSSVVVGAVVDAPVVSAGEVVVVSVEELVVVEPVKASTAEKGFPSASAPDDMTPRTSSDTVAATTFAYLFDLFVRSSTVLPLSSPQFVSTLLVFRPLAAISDPSRLSRAEATTRQRQPPGCLTRLVASPLPQLTTHSAVVTMLIRSRIVARKDSSPLTQAGGIRLALRVARPQSYPFGGSALRRSGYGRADEPCEGVAMKLRVQPSAARERLVAEIHALGARAFVEGDTLELSYPGGQFASPDARAHGAPILRPRVGRGGSERQRRSPRLSRYASCRSGLLISPLI